MGCEEYRKLLMALIDGEISPEDEQTLSEHLITCSECRTELEHMRRLKEVTGSMKVTPPEDEFWGSYWLSVYNRLERGLGWILTSIGAIVVLFFGAYHAVEGIIRAQDMGPALKTGILALLAGLCVLLVSIVREQFFRWKKERYREVKR